MRLYHLIWHTQSAKIPRGRQDTHVARMTEFLGRVVGILAPVVMQRFDQRRACRHRMLPAQRIIGKPSQIARAVEQSLGDEMNDFFRAALNIAFDQHQPSAHHFLAKTLQHLRPHDDIGDASFVLQGHEDDATSAPRTLPHQHHPGATNVFPLKHRPQKFHRVPL